MDSASEDEKKREEGTTGSAGGVLAPIPAPTVRFALEGTTGERPAMATIMGADSEKMRRSKSESTLHGLGGGAGGMEVGLTLPAASPQALDLATTTVPGGVSRSTSHLSLHRNRSSHSLRRLEKQEYAFQVPPQDIEPIPSGASQHSVASTHEDIPIDQEVGYRFRKKTYREMLKVYQGRISTEKWWKAALRPFILYAYPAIAFVLNPPAQLIVKATLLYSLSVVWLIVLSEVVAQIFQAGYPLQTLLVNIDPTTCPPYPSDSSTSPPFWAVSSAPPSQVKSPT